MRLAPPAGGTTLFDHQPELFRSFNQLYGTLWSHGVLDQGVKEAGRLRNARYVDCKICRNLRFEGATAAGLTEDLIELIEDGYEDSDLPHRYKLAIRYTDVLITDPAALSDELKAELAAAFTPAEIVELTATVTLAAAFSKVAVAWGPPPEIPVLAIPTPAPDGAVTEVAARR
ncbi:carboxymuconolactone decarboxylase family protein [Frankia sp. CNm7]|uniref:Carboxymuconolactone decarboxylase family protein n=1 Tax=Frankia nepalensis TaxID=1836974 RepID=A0A937UTH8_9ACTN|nr:carboxymuconolactone decarboxylase family protein [Frankia nepalensis]MBL7501527.1 carboxymuconolactone decarboxylase family protein [Frankia nepalensis]MBL7515298.1 carboxymuconolactone decarboxylase family protein [Frankia nepalensis]MBL7523580.1 carboxymuconolactone decarboxylase family protein [Frankia nepalensis]MBL7630031.1 carboxymuconolactone decarboxylase family protein [Frankia nepalensis]